MTKSNRRRKLDRAKRQTKDSQQQVVARRRQARQQRIDDTVAYFKRLSDPDTPVSDLADLLSENYRGGPVSIFVVNEMTALGWSTERMTAVAEAMLASGGRGESGDADESEPSLTALTFAAEAARAAGDSARARELLDRALEGEAARGSDLQWRLMDHLRIGGRLADAITKLEARLRDAPDDDRAASQYGIAISEAHLRATGQQPTEACSCGKGADWEECCGPRERAAISRFADRSGLTALSEAVRGFLASSEYGRAVDDQVDRYIAPYKGLGWEPDELASFRTLLAEHALLTAKPEDDALGLLQAFAAELSTPAELPARAEAWRTHMHYGLWQVESAPPAPGLWCTDIFTGMVRHAEFPAGFTDGWPSWSVWLGGIVPVDGIWRVAGPGWRLSPAEADAAAEYVDSAVTGVAFSLAGKKKAPPMRPDDPMRIGFAEPYGVYVEHHNPMDSDLAVIAGMVVGQVLSRIVSEIHLYRALAGEPLSGGDGWEKYWLDDRLPALHGQTPLEAAYGKERPRLEALLRQFEYEADLLAAQGRSGVDTNWLRQELEMEEIPPDELEETD